MTTMNVNSSIEEVLGIPYEPTANINTTSSSPVPPTSIVPYNPRLPDDIIDPNSAEKQLNDAVKKLISLSDVGQAAAESLWAVATDSQHPGAYRALSELLRSTGEITEKIATIKKTHVETMVMNKNKTVGSTGATFNFIDKAVVGTTQDLVRLAKEKKKIEDVSGES